MFRLFFITSLFFTVFASDVLAKVECVAKPAGKINVVWSSDNIEYNFNRSQSQLDRIDIDTKNPYDRSVKTHVGGLMNGGISMNSKVQVSTLTYPRSRKVCQWVDRMNVNIVIDPEIFVAKEHVKGTCKHNAILNHEMKHIFVDREIVKKYVPIIKRELQLAIRKVGIVGPKNDRDARKYQDKITAYMNKTLSKVMDELNEERRVKQQNVDTLSEYERVSNQCN